MATTSLKLSVPKELPPANSDFYQFTDLLSDEERAVVQQTRAFMDTKVAPITTRYWTEDATAAGLYKGEFMMAMGTARQDVTAYAFGAHFVEVRVHSRTCEIRVPRVV